jgi:hypothetical protein
MNFPSVGLIRGIFFFVVVVKLRKAKNVEMWGKWSKQ